MSVLLCSRLRGIVGLPTRSGGGVAAGNTTGDEGSSDVSSEYSTSSSSLHHSHRLQQEAVHKLSSQGNTGASGGSCSPRSKLSTGSGSGGVAVIRGRTGSSSAAAAAVAVARRQLSSSNEVSNQAIALTDYSSSPTSTANVPDHHMLGESQDKIGI